MVENSPGRPPEGYAYGPPYKPTLAMVLRGAAYIVLGRPRSLARDALVALGHMPVPPVVRGQDRIPEEGRFVVVANHYERPGLWMAWPAMYVGHLIRERTGQDTRWIAIQEWDSLSLWGIPIPRAVIRAVFERAFRVYGIIAMPALRAPAAARAGAMRTAAMKVKRGEILGLMPEGTVGPTPELLDAREGAGAFLILLTTSGVPILPVGLYEERGRLVAHFGEPFRLESPKDLAKDARDSWARRHVMEVIKALLPQPLWGVFREPSPNASEPA